MKTIPFTKMHGIGNDFVVLDCIGEISAADIPDPDALAARLCRRNYSVGADGLLLLLPGSDGCDARMRIFNADGSEAEMCGNGIRCISRLIHERGYASGDSLTIATRAGTRHVEVSRDADGRFMATVDMGSARFDGPQLPAAVTDVITELPITVGGRTFVCTAVSVGNPHGVVFVDSFDDFDIRRIGPLLEHNPIWPGGANIQFAQIRPDGSVRLRSWERGAGLTLACGTGACAVAAAAVMTGRAAAPMTIILDGGTLYIDIRPDGHILMTGPAETAFEGSITV